MSERAKIALVLAGGAARGAYEVGVVKHVVEEVSKTLGYDVPLDILCGTSVGAINACTLAALADQPKERAAHLARVWSNLSVEELVKPDVRGMIALGARWVRGGGSILPEHAGGVVDPSALERVIERAIPFRAIDGHLQAGLFDALTVSTTHIATGRTVVYVHRKSGDLPSWSLDPTQTPRATTITAKHAFASAAIPILFRPVRLDGEWHCDGGLRQNVPLSPARRLGARGVLVVNPRYLPPHSHDDPPASEDSLPGPIALLGKALNALLLDRIETDLSRLRGINEILEAGTRRYGPTFIDDINETLGKTRSRRLHPMRSMLVRVSQDIGRVAAEHVRSASFAARVGGGAGRLMRRLAERETDHESDLLSYLLFDGEFARKLIEIGLSDARARHEELCGFFDSLAQTEDA